MSKLRLLPSFLAGRGIVAALPPGYKFTSDNCARICPEASQAIEAANRDHAASYGEDEWTRRACDLVRETFEADCDVYFVATGTAANALGLATTGRSIDSVLCHELSHIATHECDAVAFFSGGMKLLALPGALGKLVPSELERRCEQQQHAYLSRPCALSVTQATEVGTVYSSVELGQLGALARRLGLRFHMDGARFANAVAALGATPAELTWKRGVDVLSFGAGKNGGQFGEAVIFFDRNLGRDFSYRCRQAGQLCSKMRFVAAPWAGMLENGAWLRHAAHANAMARRLRDALVELPGVKLLFPVETNAVFVELPSDALAAMRSTGWQLPTVFGETGCRLMCAWDTTSDDVDAFGGELKACLEG